MALDNGNLAGVTGAELKRIREALGLKQGELAAALGVTPGAVSRWEAGERRIPEPAARLAQRLLKEKRQPKPRRSD